MNCFMFIIILSAIGCSKCATLPDKRDLIQEINSNEDLLYSEDTKSQENTLRLYRTFRYNYGVPSEEDHKQMRRLTIGERMGHENNNNSDATIENERSAPFDPWSIVWYIGSFGGLIAFFLVISCSEWCCLRSRTTATIISAQISAPHRTISGQLPPQNVGEVPVCDSPPPAYHLFAPPSYDDSQMFEKKTVDVFVVPVHCGPPKYSTVFKN